MALVLLRSTMLFVAFALLAAVTGAEVTTDELMTDDECLLEAAKDNPNCALNALQLRASHSASEEPPAAQTYRLLINDEPEDIHVEVIPEETLGAAVESSASCGCCCHNGEEKISSFWDTCAARENSCCKSCGIWNAQHNRGMHGSAGRGAVVVGVMVVPTTACSGMEGITSATAGEYDYLWNVGAQHIGHASNMALICNPFMSRTQHQLHIHMKPLSGTGQSTRNSLEKITGCRTGMWHDAHVHLGGCHISKVRVYDAMPGVFSSVFHLAMLGQLGAMKYGPHGATLGNDGISVFFLCGGKVGVLATSSSGGYCSIEHYIA